MRASEANGADAGAGTGTAEPAVDVEGLRVTIQGSLVLQGVDLTVPRGEVTALLGRNGVGKTTTLRALIGLQAGCRERANSRSRDTRMAGTQNYPPRHRLRPRRP